MHVYRSSTKNKTLLTIRVMVDSVVTMRQVGKSHYELHTNKRSTGDSILRFARKTPAISHFRGTTWLLIINFDIVTVNTVFIEYFKGSFL